MPASIAAAVSSVDMSAPLQLADFQCLADALASAPDTTPLAFSDDTPARGALLHLLAFEPLASFLVRVSRSDVFSPSTAAPFAKSLAHIAILRAYKHLKFCYSIPVSSLLSSLSDVMDNLRPSDADPLRTLTERILADDSVAPLFLKHFVLSPEAPPALRTLYEQNAKHLISDDPHAIYPTSVYRSSFGHCVSSTDSTAMEATMGTTVSTSIRIDRDILKPESPHLRQVFGPLRRCVAVIDERVDNIYGPTIEAYFAHHNISLQKLSYRCMEVDKDISSVQQILTDLKAARVSRNEPVLVVGGGVISDIAGFACALYHRNTPYVMLCTSIVSAIDAGPSPRTCCDGLGYKNVFGAYHPPILTLSDRSFFRTLRPGWIRHGLAEIIKMSVTKDASLFDNMEAAGARLIDTKFGIENCEPGSEIDTLCERIFAQAMDSYVRAEYGNLWETHQCRPHAYGHTWSPGFELQAGLLHGHAVSIGMGFGAYLSREEGWISDAEFHRILRVMSAVGLSLRHEILENVDVLWSSQVKMTEKRGGNLCAPVPKGAIGQCGYINELSREQLDQAVERYDEIVREYPRNGLGIEPHCADVGLEDPSTVKQHADHAVAKGSMSNGAADAKSAGESIVHDGKSEKVNGNGVDSHHDIAKYNAWIEAVQKERCATGTSSALAASQVNDIDDVDTKTPPPFPHPTLFHDRAEEYATSMTTLSSKDFVMIGKETADAGLFAPCMVGRLEGQFLKMVTGLMNAKRVLDIGTFTGYSALAFAQGVGKGGEVISLEADKPTAAVARRCMAQATDGSRVKIVECDARAEVSKMANAGEKFDIVFLDADKTNYKHYYEEGLRLLSDGGLLMADNAMCSLVYADSDPASQALHEFAQYVRADRRVEQVMLTAREGILMVRKV